MYRSDPFPIKKIFLWSIVGILGLIIFFVIFVSIISIRIGLSNVNQDGFIIPVLSGIFSIAICLFLFICFIRFIINILREKDIIRSS